MVQESLITEENPRTVRIKFEKTGSLQYISHLDLNRTFSHAIIRAKIPVWYTQGFNPHTKMIFATPLSVGAESVCEYMDIKIVKEISLDEIKRRLAENLPPEMKITKVYFPISKFTDIAWSEYDIAIKTSNADAALAENINKIFAEKEITVLKKTKSGEKDADIKPYILSFRAEYEDGLLKINTVLCCDTQNFLNPEYIVKVIKERAGILAGNPTEEFYSIMRKEIYTPDGKTVFE